MVHGTSRALAAGLLALALEAGCDRPAGPAPDPGPRRDSKVARLAADRVREGLARPAVGSEMATKWYVEQVLDAGCAFVNCIPVFIAREGYWRRRFEERGLPVVGDDVKSQVGATIVHRVLARLFNERGVRLERTSQLNFGGNTDFYNMLERERLISKKISKTDAVRSQLDHELPAAESPRLAAHLQDCGACSGYVDDLRELSAMHRTTAAAPDADEARVLDAVAGRHALFASITRRLVQDKRAELARLFYELGKAYVLLANETARSGRLHRTVSALTRPVDIRGVTADGRRASPGTGLTVAPGGSAARTADSIAVHPSPKIVVAPVSVRARASGDPACSGTSRSRCPPGTG